MIWPVNYDSTTTPPAYVCKSCGVSGVKLWREYSMFLNHQTLECFDCATKSQGKDAEATDANHYAIGWRVLAVPTEEGDTFWGYSSVPAAGMEWWRRLPTHKVSP